MKPREGIEPQFVEEIPHDLEDGILYISIEYTTAVHLCCCGCRTEVITPLHPTRWALAYDGDSVSLRPSVGNWGLPCRSHYVIARNRVRWAPRWTEDEIRTGRNRDRALAERYYADLDTLRDEPEDADPRGPRWRARFWRRRQGR